MHAYSCCSGGVMFVPDEIEYTKKPKSYKDFVKEDNGELKKRKLFGRKKADEKSSRKAA